MDKYIDPDNMDEIIQELAEKRTLKDVIDYIDVIFPEWIVSFSEKYSDSYPLLTESWKKACDELQVKPTQIMIVDKVDFTEDHKLLTTIGDLFTKAGFSVRSKDHLLPCVKCGSSYPSQSIHTILKEAAKNPDTDVPEKWGCCT